MSCLFKVNGRNRFENNKKMTVSVYGVRAAAEQLRSYANISENPSMNCLK